MQRRLLSGETVTIHPAFARLARTTAIGAGLGLGPPFVALYLLGWGAPDWPLIVAANAAVVIVTYAVIARTSAAQVTFSREGIREVGFFGGVVWTPVTRIASICVAEVHSSRTLATHLNVFFLDGAGRTVLRLREQFWGRKAMEFAIRAYEVPVDRIADPMSKTDLRTRFRSNLYLYERYPLVTYTIGGIAVLALATPTIAAFNAII